MFAAPAHKHLNQCRTALGQVAKLMKLDRPLSLAEEQQLWQHFERAQQELNSLLGAVALTEQEPST